MVIRKGTRVDMPVYTSHHNPEFFPEPDKFRPERFFKENAADIIPYTYRPFGGNSWNHREKTLEAENATHFVSAGGARVCIGQRFAQSEMKIALAKLISKYRIVPTPETKLDIHKGGFFLRTFPDMKVELLLRK